MIDARDPWHSRIVHIRAVVLSSLACSLFALACSDADPDDPEVPGPLEARASIPVGGGMVELSDGARVVFPDGALMDTADVTLRRLGCGGIYQAASFGGCRYAVEGPAELLAGAYELELPTRAPSCASQQTGDGLLCMFGSHTAGEKVTTLASDFSEFTAWADDAIIPKDACVMPDFAACGGDLLGSWALTSGCGSIEQLTNVSWSSPDPYESCDPLDHYRGYPFSISGALEFSDAGYTISSGFSIKKHEIVTSECLASIGSTCHPDCTEVDGVCECLWPDSDGEGQSGNDVWTTDNEGTVTLSEVDHRYCIVGDVLILEWGPEGDRYYTIYARE